MTIEELEIVIKANVEQALQQVKRLKPEIERATSQVSEKMGKLEISGFNSDLGEGITKATGKIKQMQEAMNKAEIGTKLSQSAEQATQAVSQTQQAIEATEATTTALGAEMSTVATETAGAGASMAQLAGSSGYALPIILAIGASIKAIKLIIQGIVKTVTLVRNIIRTVATILYKVATFNLGKLLGADIRGALKNIMQYASTLFSLRSIYQTLQSSAQSWLSSQNAQAQQLSANIEYMKYALGGTLAPIMEYLVNLAYTLLRAIQTLLYTFTGVNIFAKATASSMKKTAGGASKASKEMQKLAGIHDEINNIGDTDSGGGGGGGGGGVSPSFDLSKLDNTPNDILDAIRSGNWEQIGVVLGEKLNEAMDKIPFSKIQDGAKKIGTGISNLINGFVKTANWDNVGNTIAQGINTAIYFAQSFLTGLNWGSIGDALGRIINGFFLNIDWDALAEAINAKVIGIFTFLAETLATIDFTAITDTIQGFFTNIDIEGMINAGAQVIENFLLGIIESAPTLIQTGADIIVRLALGISNKLPTLIPLALKAILTIAQSIITALPNIIKSGIEIVVALAEGISESLSTLLDEAPELIVTIVTGIDSVLHKMDEAGIRIILILIQGLIKALPSLLAFVPKMIIMFTAEFPHFYAQLIESGFLILETLIDGLIKCLPVLVATIPTVVERITSTLIKYNPMFIEGGVRIILALIQGLMSVAGQLASATWNLITSGIKNTITSIGSNAYQWGRDMIQGFINGIRSMLSNVASSAQSIANKIKSFLHFSKPDVGPLRDYETYMPDFVKGLAKTMLESAPILEDATKSIAEQMSQSINGMALNNNLAFEGLQQSEDLRVQSSFKETLVGALTGTDAGGVTIPLKFEIGGQTLIDTIIDGINEKTQRLGRDVILRVGD